ncbi:VanZ family protein (plasmid) [Cetobacterium somerae]|uniref:VanZ family protein n=1 Tax=Cetobacterium somerae TaxID=188913 RepID=UPI001F05F333|nr:VanZ family protein [Cetobacterium somerae]UPO98676.1 VanZ family protein [Cetobacterium somerae]
MSRIKLFRIISIAIMILIFWFSHQNGEESLKQSNFILQYLKEFLDIFNLGIRKLAHFTIYLILGSSYFLSFKSLDKKSVIISITLTFLYACTDEFHQGFVPGRGPALKDVFIDTLGGCLGIVLIFLFFNSNKKPIIK